MRTVNKPQTSLWIEDRFVNLYSFKTVDKEATKPIGAVSAQYFLKRATLDEVTSLKAKLMVDSLVDPEDANVIMSLSDNDLRWHFQDWVIADG